MAIFPSDTASNIESADDLAKVRQYLRKLNDDLTYMFNNLTPEDNYSASAPKLIYSVDENGEASFEISSSGIKMRVASDEYVKSNVEILDNKISLKVSIGDVTSNLNSELRVEGNAITINSTGHLLINTDNFKVNAAGNVTIMGALTAGSTITGSSFSGGSISIGGTTLAPAFAVDSQGNLTATKGSISIGGTQNNPTFRVDSQGNMTAMSGTFKGSIAAATDPNNPEASLVAGDEFSISYLDNGNWYEINAGAFVFDDEGYPYGDSFANTTIGDPEDTSDRFLVSAGSAEIYCYDIYPWTQGERWSMGLARKVDYLWDEVFGGGGGGGGGSESESDIPIDSELDGPLDP